MFNKSRVGIHAAVVAGSVLVCGVLPEASADVGVQLRASESPNSPYGETVELYSKSYALVIGIDDYTDGWPRLSNAVKDARAVADALTKRGFDVTLGLNLNSRDMKEAFERACVLSAGLGESTKEIQAISGLWGHYWMRARHDRALELGKMLLVKAEPLDDPVPLIVGNRALGSTLFTLGDFVSAREHLEQALSLSRQATAEDLSSSYAVNPQIAARLMLGWDLWILGYPDQALDHVRQAFEEATDLAHPYSVAFTHYVTSAIHLLRGEPRDSIVHADRSLEISREHRINLYAIYSRFGRGCALAEMSRPDDAISEIQGGIEEARRSNLGYMRGFMLGWLASVLAETGEREAAMATVDDAIKGTDDVSGRAWESELHRLRGTILLAAHVGVHDDSERCFNKAIAVARRQGARSLELRATTELSRLWQGQGKTRQARDLLAPVHDWFTEGLDTADLKEAKALLEDLS